MSNFNFKYALVCSRPAKTLAHGLAINPSVEEVNMTRAEAEHDEYLQYLEREGIKLLKIEPDDAYPDCVFVEDCAVALKNKIFLTNPGALSRRGELNAVRSLFHSVKTELGLEIGEIQNKENAFMDGGDVLFTGKEFIVGLSKRTNQAGADEFKSFFSDVKVTVVRVGYETEDGEALHLKSCISLYAPNAIVCSSSPTGLSIRSQIESVSEYGKEYSYLMVGSDPAANVLLLNEAQLYPQNYEAEYAQYEHHLKGIRKLPAHNNEYKKIDGCLTCRSVLF